MYISLVLTVGVLLGVVFMLLRGTGPIGYGRIRLARSINSLIVGVGVLAAYALDAAMCWYVDQTLWVLLLFPVGLLLIGCASALAEFVGWALGVTKVRVEAYLDTLSVSDCARLFRDNVEKLLTVSYGRYKVLALVVAAVAAGLGALAFFSAGSLDEHRWGLVALTLLALGAAGSYHLMQLQRDEHLSVSWVRKYMAKTGVSQTLALEAWSYRAVAEAKLEKINAPARAEWERADCDGDDPTLNLHAMLDLARSHQPFPAQIDKVTAAALRAAAATLPSEDEAQEAAENKYRASDDYVREVEEKFVKELYSTRHRGVPCDVKGHDVYRFLMLRGWYRQLATQAEHDEKAMSLLRQDWLAYMDALREIGDALFMVAETDQNAPRHKTYEAEHARIWRTIRSVEDAFAGAVGAEAVEHLRRARAHIHFNTYGAPTDAAGYYTNDPDHVGVHVSLTEGLESESDPGVIHAPPSAPKQAQASKPRADSAGERIEPTLRGPFVAGRG